ncbi:MAG: NAD+ synthase [Candidatus Omnitrophota bacterium]
MPSIRIALAQLNPIVGDLKCNTEKIVSYIDSARKNDVDMVVFPELAITGYPPEDLLLKPHFIRDNLGCLKKITSYTKDIIVIVGFVNSANGKAYNSAALLADNKIVFIHDKVHLPNYGVFDEVRYFGNGKGYTLVKSKDFSFVMTICEDIWKSTRREEKDYFSKADFLINISASPYYIDKLKERQGVLKEKAKKYKRPIIYCNLVGGQDELIFDGRSSLFDAKGKCTLEGKAFEEDMLLFDIDIDKKKKSSSSKTRAVKLIYSLRDKVKTIPKRPIKSISKIEEIYNALILGIRDYVKKNGFKKIVLGISGGIDSALVACLSAKAVGPGNVLGISMPSRFSSRQTQDDGEKICSNLGIGFKKVPIDAIFDLYNETLKGHFEGRGYDITEENMQARIRGNILMAFSNKFGYLVLNTGNKSETSVGYCTLYGDMAGGFAVIKDVPKNLVYALTDYINTLENRELIPSTIIQRAPSAELRVDQKDQDSLPSYDILDNIIEMYIRENKGFDIIAKKIGNKDIVKKVLNMIDINEYKRRQSPPGIKITSIAFGKDRRMPITNRYKEDDI